MKTIEINAHSSEMYKLYKKKYKLHRPLNIDFKIKHLTVMESKILNSQQGWAIHVQDYHIHSK